jgi:Spy/CpxP family protein refolding chaperone
MRSRFWLVVAGLAGASALTAQEPPPPPSPESPRPLRQRIHQPEGAPGFMSGFMMYAPDRLVDRRAALNLTPEQVSRLESLAQEARTARAQADTAARTHEEPLRALWDADAPDVRAIETHMQAANAARQAGQLAAARAAARAKAVLTPEQRGRVDGWREGARAMVHRRGIGPRPDRPGRMDGPRRPGMGFRRG